MNGSYFLLQGLHLRLDFDKGLPACPDLHANRTRDDICSETNNFSKTKIDHHDYDPTVSDLCCCRRTVYLPVVYPVICAIG